MQLTLLPGRSNKMLNHKISLNGLWDFAYLPEWDTNKLILPTPESFCAKMTAPAYWDDHLPQLRRSEIWRNLKYNPVEPGPLRWPSALNPGDISLPFIVGVGFYKTRIKTPLDDHGKNFTLYLGGASLEAWVFLNAKNIGYHMGSSTPFEFHLPLLSEHENEIVIAVSNLRIDRRGSSLRGYAGRSAGIKGGVFLRSTGHTRIDSVFLKPNPKEDGILWEVELSQLSHNKNKLNIHYEIISRITNKIVGEGIHQASLPKVKWETSRFDLMAWSDNDPVMYDIKVDLLDGPTILDTHSQSFGYRTVKIDTKRLYLNGNPVYLRGTCEHHYFPLTCTAHNNLEEYRENLRRLKGIGFNWLRFHTWVPPKEYLQAADEVGLLVQIEPPVNSTDEEWSEIIRSCRVHPSVIIYCVGNEATLDEAKIELVTRWAALQKNIAPDALFSPQEAMHGVQGGNLGNDITQEPFPHNNKRLEKLREVSDVMEPYEGDLSHGTMHGKWREMEKKFSIFQRPLFVHEIGIHGGYIDIGLEHRYDGTRIGPDLFTATRLHFSENKLLDKASLYYQNSCAHMRIQRKYAVENTRKCNSVSGYDFLGATDAHWHRTGYECGIMNEFYELKHGESAADVLKYNSESVLLIDCDTNRNFYGGSKVQFDAMISHFGNTNIDKANISWFIKDNSKVLLSGNFHCHNLNVGALTSLGKISFIMPALETAKKITFVMRLNGGNYDLENQWNFWTYPSASSRKQKFSFNVIDKFTPAILNSLENGARFIFLGKTPFHSMETHFMSSSSGRAGNHKGTVIHDHPSMESFPHEGYFDLQFFDMFDSGVNPVTFEDEDLPFDPIIELISPFKRARKISVLFEYQVGRGKLLVCSLNLNNREPGTEYFKSMLEQYVSSDKFNPRSSIDAKVLEKYILNESAVDKKFTTDEGNDPNAVL